MKFFTSDSDFHTELKTACRSGAGLCRKVYLELTPPSDLDTTADSDRMLQALEAEFQDAVLPYHVLKRDYPAFREDHWKITVSLVYNGTGWTVASIESGDRTGSNFSLAVDLGSTTVVMALLDLNTGDILGEESVFNQQIAYGEDILSRIFHTQSGEQERRQLAEATFRSLQELMDRLTERTGIRASSCPVMVIAGNTTMIHFLLGIDAFGIFMSPFAPVFNRTGLIAGSELGLDFSGLICCIPSAANYLGGDIISGVMASGMTEDTRISLYIDIGTNGEMVIGSADFLVSGAGAAGPALEGGISRYGMRADSGAVDSVSITDGIMTITTIDSAPPKGICGSGIVDLLAAMFLNGWMDFQGNLNEEMSERITRIDGQPAVVYAWGTETEDGQDRYFSQQDIYSFMDTKAAAATMVSCLLSETGIAPEQVDRIYMAGSFGKYLNLESAIAIGLYPDLPREKFICIGNGSLKGALLLLSRRALAASVSSLIPNMHYLQFAMVEDFVTRMQAARFFPHTDLDTYPSVKEELIRRGILRP